MEEDIAIADINVQMEGDKKVQKEKRKVGQKRVLSFLTFRISSFLRMQAKTSNSGIFLYFFKYRSLQFKNLNYLLNRYLNIFNNKKVSQNVFFYLIFLYICK